MTVMTDSRDQRVTPDSPGQGQGSSSWPTTQPASTWARTLIALAFAFLGCLFIWIAAPFNNFILNLGFISDDYTPAAALIFVFALPLLVNPVLRRIAPRYVLGKPHMALAVGMMLVAATLPGQGLLRMLPYMLVQAPHDTDADQQLADIYEDMNLPASLFPDKTGYDAAGPVTDDMYGALSPGDVVPWDAWLAPLFTWGVLLLFLWLFLIGLALIVFPQWRRNERLPFPLLNVYNSLIEEPEEGHTFARLFRTPAFWWGVGMVFFLLLLRGMSKYFPGQIPPIPLEWDLSPYMSAPPWNRLPTRIRINQIFFAFVGVAYFMPVRISFSIWFFTVVYGIYQALAITYWPPYYGASVEYQRSGATIVGTLFILWLGRAHWLRVVRTMFRRAESEDDVRDRRAGYMFFAGVAGMFGWLVWVGVQPMWALFFICIGFMVSIMVTRIVAETGMPFVRIQAIYPEQFAEMVPASWVSPHSILFCGFISMFFQLASRTSVTAMAAHALGLGEDEPPRTQARTGLLMLGALVVGLLICGGAHLYFAYNYDLTLDGNTVNPWGFTRLTGVHRQLVQHLRGNWPASKPYSPVGHIAFGAGLAGLLQYLSLAWPRWPLHPIGLVLVFSYYANEAWVSIFIGWALKKLVIAYGGSHFYRRAQPFFIGLIVGHALGLILWSVVPAILGLLGRTYVRIILMPT